MVSHLLPNKAPIATLRCLRLVPSHIRTDWFWHPSQHIHNAVLLLGGFGSLLSRITIVSQNVSVDFRDYIYPRLRHLEDLTSYPKFAHKPIDSDKTPKCVPTIQESDSDVKCALTSHSVGQKMNVVDSFKKTRGRPKGSGAMTLRKYADNPQALILPKTEQQQVKELKDLLIKSAGANVVHKAVEIAMNDEHPAQMAAIKLCMDRMLPVSLFEKEGKQRSAVNITISGIGGVSIGENTIDAEDIEDKNEL